jgi:hypothetical protein
MRTTLDIDDDVLQTAKELARAEKTTVGRVVSQLARRGLALPSGSGELSVEIVDGIPVLPPGSRIVTNEMIEELIEQADLEDAGRLEEE